MRKLPLFIAVLALIAIFAFNIGPATAQAQGRIYVVQPGDNLFGIASRFNVSISELATINRVYDVNLLFVGQVLTLPAPLPNGVIQRLPVPGGSPIVITNNSGGFGVGGPNISNTQIFTPPVVTFPSGTTVTTVTTYKSYTVRQGDFLASIAQRFNTTPQAIMSANAISDPNLLFVGQLLSIPSTRTTVMPQPRMVVQRTMGRVYIVQPGDNLFSIAARTGRNAWTIASANGILDLNAIFVGQPLVIP